MRLASFNVENLFDRARVFGIGDTSEGKAILKAFAEINALLAKETYDSATKTRIVKLLGILSLTKSSANKYTMLRENRGKLIKRSRANGLEVVAEGRSSWIGWVELVNAEVTDTTVENTARVIKDVNADILAVVEADDRISLRDFSNTLIERVGGKPYANVMLIDGNDLRGIDVGIMTRDGFEITNARSHVEDKTTEGLRLYSRDCPEYCIETPSGNKLWVLVNHYKSKGYGSPVDSNAKRKREANNTAAIYRRLRDEGHEFIAIVGDLNDTPDSDPLDGLINGSDLTDVFHLASPNFDSGGYPGTYGGSTKSNKIDYILMSPALVAKANKGGVFRKGMWPGVRPKKWECYDTISNEDEAASDHACLWVDLDI